ncbi:DALR domain-containing protein [Escherichia coli]
MDDDFNTPKPASVLFDRA